MPSTRTIRAGPACRILIAATSLWLPCACATADAPAGAEAPMEKIRALIGDAACDSDAQCRTLAMGAKACGGPEYYLAWSTKRTDAAALRDAVAGDGAVRRPEPPRPGVRSDCALVTDPGAYCAPPGSTGTGAAPSQGRVCRLRSTRQGGSGPVD
jgi:hypothetical protein